MQVGDLVKSVHKGRRKKNKKYVGLIREIDGEAFGKAGRVSIEWYGDEPDDYYDTYGYGILNLHNDYRFEIVNESR
jgi:hypothetical protein